MFGLWLVLQNIGYLIWGNSDRSILTPRTLSSWHLGPITIPTVRLTVFIPAVCSLGLLEFVLRRTWYGRGVRALMQNRYAGRLAGIPVEKMARLTFGVGIGLAGAAGGVRGATFLFWPAFGRGVFLRSVVVI